MGAQLPLLALIPFFFTVVEDLVDDGLHDLFESRGTKGAWRRSGVVRRTRGRRIASDRPTERIVVVLHSKDAVDLRKSPPNFFGSAKKITRD